MEKLRKNPVVIEAMQNGPYTARQIIERRLGRDLGPLASMPHDLRQALYFLALQMVKVRKDCRLRNGELK